MKVNNIIVLIIVLFGTIFLTSCQEVEKIYQIVTEDSSSAGSIPSIPIVNVVHTNISQTNISPKTNGISPELKIGSFNSQVFGVSKVEDASSLYIISHIVDSYDIIAFQEIRDASYTAFPKLMAKNPHLKYVISSRMGKTNSKEQYAFIYDPQKVQFLNSKEYQDPTGIFERPPFIAAFKFQNNQIIFIQIHVKPDNAEKEIAALEEVISDLRMQYPGEEDIIILGDLNADCTYYNNDKHDDLADYNWIITDDMDTTTKSTNCAYDRIIVSQKLNDNIKYSGVDRFDIIYTLNQTETQDVSDHYPVYAILHEVENE
jgi:deoxyribonuclease-1-like protein